MPRPRSVAEALRQRLRAARTARTARTGWLAGGLVAVVAATLTLWAAGPASAVSTTYEAESATLTGGAVVATDHSGYSGTGFVGEPSTTFPNMCNLSMSRLGVQVGVLDKDIDNFVYKEQLEKIN